MCFAPQRRALFQHLNCQKWSGPGVFCTFWLQNVLRATTACTFSTSQLPKVVRPWCVLYILTSKCASRHNGVQIFISHLASWLRTRRFSEPTFRPSGATEHWKNTVFRDFPTFSRICVFCPLTLSLLIFSLLIFLFSLPLPCSAFHLSILSEVWLLNFLRTVRFAFENGVRGMGTTVHSREGRSPGRAFDLAELREEPASKFSNMQHLVRILHEFYLAYHTGSEACACQQEQRDSMAQQGTRQVQVGALCSTPFST